MPHSEAASLNMGCPSPFYAVVRGGQNYFHPAMPTIDIYSYALTDRILPSIAGGRTRTFTYDAAGNTIYDNRSGGGYEDTYDVLGRMASFAIKGIVGKLVPQTNF